MTNRELILTVILLLFLSLFWIIQIQATNTIPISGLILNALAVLSVYAYARYARA